MSTFLDIVMDTPAQNKSVKALSMGVVQLDKQLSDRLVQAMNAAGFELSNRVRETFDVKGARGGHARWEVHANPTPLIDTWELYNSIEGVVVENEHTMTLYIGTNSDYAQINNEGGQTRTDVSWYPPKDEGKESNWLHTNMDRPLEIPKREFLFLVSDDMDYLNGILETAITQVFDRFTERI